MVMRAVMPELLAEKGKGSTKICVYGCTSPETGIHQWLSGTRYIPVSLFPLDLSSTSSVSYIFLFLMHAFGLVRRSVEG